MGKKYRVTQKEYIITLDDGKDYTIRPLSLSKARELQSLLKDVDKLDPNADVEDTPGLVEKLIEVCFIVLKKSNPEITKEKVSEIVSVTNMQPIISIAFGGSPNTEVEEEK